VLDGRDIGTVVMPEAALKFYLDASPEERARRRYVEQVGRGKAVIYDEILADLRRRDQLDSERAYAPLRAAADAIVIDTSTLSLDEVIVQILAATRQHLI
jgi:cytidylate kinase